MQFFSTYQLYLQEQSSLLSLTAFHKAKICLYAFERGALSRSALLLLPSSGISAAWITQFNNPSSKAFIFSDYFVPLHMI